MKGCCLCCRSSWLIITKPQILAAGHVRLHCPWPWWTRKDISPSEAFTDSCQPEHLVATVPDTVSRKGEHHSSHRDLNFILHSAAWPAWSPFLPAHPFARQRRPPRSGGAHICPISMSFCTRPRTLWDQDPWGLDTSGCLCARGVALSEPTWRARDEAGTVHVTRRDCRDKWTQCFFSVGVPHSKQGWRLCYCLNNQSSWRQQSSYQYFCRIKIQVSKNRVSLKLDLNQTA